MLFAKKVATEVVKNSITNKKVIGVAVVGFLVYQGLDYWKTRQATKVGVISAHKKMNEGKKK